MAMSAAAFAGEADVAVEDAGGAVGGADNELPPPGVVAGGAAAGGAAEDAAAGPKPPMHPYTESDMTDKGIKCFHCKGEFFSKSWDALSTHLRQAHKYSRAEQKGSKLYDLGRAVELEKNRKRRQAAAAEDDAPAALRLAAAPQPTTAAQNPVGPQSASVLLWAPPASLAGVDVLDNGHATLRRWPNGQAVVECDGTCWRACWVRCSSDGIPLAGPVVLDEIGEGGTFADFMSKPAVHVPVNQSASHPPPATPTAKVPAKPEQLELMMPLPQTSAAPASARKPTTAASSSAAASATQVKHTTPANLRALFRLPAPPPNVPHHADAAASATDVAATMLKQIESVMQTFAGSKTAWKDTLPAVRLKEVFVSCQPPDAKGDGVRRATWPKELTTMKLQVPQFLDYLKRDKSLKHETTGAHVRGMSRIFDMIESDYDGTGFKATCVDAASDVKLVCSILTHKLYIDIFEMPIMDFKYGWAGEILESLITFCRWHIHDMAGKIVEGELGHWQEFTAALNRLLTHLEGGYRKRSAAIKDRNVLAKQQEDLSRIRKLPTVQQLKEGVANGFTILKLISRTYAGHSGRLPARVQGLANCCLIGSVWLNMFGGRKMEWETLSLKQVQHIFQDDIDYIVVMNHKTAATYGSLAKWLPPGVRDAFACYMRLPRPDDVTTFFVPAHAGTSKVDVPCSLHGFAARFLPAEASRPTVNLMRKYFHKSLMNLTQDHDSLKKVMTVLDGHSGKTIDKHYSLREPTDDVALAKLLVANVLGDTVAWPASDAIEQGPAYLNEVLDKYADLDLNVVCTSLVTFADCSDDDDEDDTFEHWQFGDIFGIKPSLPVICDDGLSPLSSGAAKEKPAAKPTAAETPKANAGTRRSAADSAVAPVAKRVKSEQPLEPGEHPQDGKQHVPRGRTSLFSPAQKDLIAWDVLQSYGIVSETNKAPNIFLKDILESGKRKGLLPDEATLDQVRHVARCHPPPKAAPPGWAQQVAVGASAAAAAKREESRAAATGAAAAASAAAPAAAAAELDANLD
jgi:hypothetical protein